MDLVASYVKAVRRYLPRAHRDDIVAELSEDLRSQIEAREANLDRPLRDDEQMALFKAYGDPMIVARRYRQKGMSLSIGWELIGPELFPMYLIILGLNTTLAIAIGIAVMLYMHQLPTVGTLLRPALIQLVCVTLTFTILNLVRRKFPQPWYYPPAELARMMPIPPWVSISGLVVWITFTLWWTALPLFPRLLLGSAAGYLELRPPWHRFYLPILLLLAVGIARARGQPGASLVERVASGNAFVHQRGGTGAATSHDQELSVRGRRPWSIRPGACCLCCQCF